MIIDFSKLNYDFLRKPLLVGGMAMEFYGLRKSGNDIDLIASKDDIARLVSIFPTKLKDLYGDFGIAVEGFEIWKTIRFFDYDFLSEGAIEENNFLVVSLEKLLLLKALAMKIPKYFNDLELVVNHINNINEANGKRAHIIKEENMKMIENLKDIDYVEKKV